MAWVTRRSARLQFFREAFPPSLPPSLFSTLFRLDFTHSSAPLSLPHHLQTVRMLCHTHTHTLTPLELNQKSMLSMASQYLIKQSPCPSWQVMHFIVLTHTHTHSDSLSLSHATHCNNLWKCGTQFLSQVVVEYVHSTSNDDRLRVVYVCVYMLLSIQKQLPHARIDPMV